MPRILKNIRIDEVSACTKGAGVGTKIVLMKRDDSDGADVYGTPWYKKQARIAEEQNEQHLRGEALRNRFLSIFKNEQAPPVDGAIADAVDRQREITFDAGDRRLTFPNERALARWLAIQERILKSEESNSMSTTPEQIEAARIAKLKSLNPTAVAKVMVEDNSSHGITESELVDLISNHDRQPGETAAKCFSRHFEAQDENGLALRKAVQIAKDMMSITPVFVGGEAVNPNDAHEAYEQLMQLAEEQRARAPWKTVAQAFADVFQDAKNTELAAKAHQRPAPSTSYPFPR